MVYSKGAMHNYSHIGELMYFGYFRDSCLQNIVCICLIFRHFYFQILILSKETQSKCHNLAVFGGKFSWTKLYIRSSKPNTNFHQSTPNIYIAQYNNALFPI